MQNNNPSNIPPINTPTHIATATPIATLKNQYELTANSLSSQLSPNARSTTSFQINYDESVESRLCSGNFEIIDMAQLRKIFEANHTEDMESHTSGLKVTLSASDGRGTDYTIGENVPLLDGDIGQTDFHLANESHFRQVVNRITDGNSNFLVLSADFMDVNGGPTGGTSLGIPESRYFETETDLEGHEIRMIRRDISKLIIQPEYYLLDVVWSFWEVDRQAEKYWLRVEPMTGTLDPDKNNTIQVEFSSDSLEAGTYTTELLIDFGENCSAPQIITVMLTVADD